MSIQAKQLLAAALPPKKFFDAVRSMSRITNNKCQLQIGVMGTCEIGF